MASAERALSFDDLRSLMTVAGKTSQEFRPDRGDGEDQTTKGNKNGRRRTRNGGNEGGGGRGGVSAIADPDAAVVCIVAAASKVIPELSAAPRGNESSPSSLDTTSASDHTLLAGLVEAMAVHVFAVLRYPRKSADADVASSLWRAVHAAVLGGPPPPSSSLSPSASPHCSAQRKEPAAPTFSASACVLSTDDVIRVLRWVGLVVAALRGHVIRHGAAAAAAGSTTQSAATSPSSDRQDKESASRTRLLARLLIVEGDCERHIAQRRTDQYLHRLLAANSHLNGSVATTAGTREKEEEYGAGTCTGAGARPLPAPWNISHMASLSTSSTALRLGLGDADIRAFASTRVGRGCSDVPSATTTTRAAGDSRSEGATASGTVDVIRCFRRARDHYRAALQLEEEVPRDDDDNDGNQLATRPGRAVMKRSRSDRAGSHGLALNQLGLLHQLDLSTVLADAQRLLLAPNASATASLPTASPALDPHDVLTVVATAAHRAAEAAWLYHTGQNSVIAPFAAAAQNARRLAKKVAADAEPLIVEDGGGYDRPSPSSQPPSSRRTKEDASFHCPRVLEWIACTPATKQAFQHLSKALASLPCLSARPSAAEVVRAGPDLTFSRSDVIGCLRARLDNASTAAGDNAGDVLDEAPPAVLRAWLHLATVRMAAAVASEPAHHPDEIGAMDAILHHSHHILPTEQRIGGGIQQRSSRKRVSRGEAAGPCDEPTNNRRGAAAPVSTVVRIRDVCAALALYAASPDYTPKHRLLTKALTLLAAEACQADTMATTKGADAGERRPSAGVFGALVREVLLWALVLLRRVCEGQRAAATAVLTGACHKSALTIPAPAPMASGLCRWDGASEMVGNHKDSLLVNGTTPIKTSPTTAEGTANAAPALDDAVARALRKRHGCAYVEKIHAADGSAASPTAAKGKGAKGNNSSAPPRILKRSAEPVPPPPRAQQQPSKKKEEQVVPDEKNENAPRNGRRRNRRGAGNVPPEPCLGAAPTPPADAMATSTITGNVSVLVNGKKTCSTTTTASNTLPAVVPVDDAAAVAAPLQREALEGVLRHWSFAAIGEAAAGAMLGLACGEMLGVAVHLWRQHAERCDPLCNEEKTKMLPLFDPDVLEALAEVAERAELRPDDPFQSSKTAADAVKAKTATPNDGRRRNKEVVGSVGRVLHRPSERTSRAPPLSLSPPSPMSSTPAGGSGGDFHPPAATPIPRILKRSAPGTVTHTDPTAPAVTASDRAPAFPSAVAAAAAVPSIALPNVAIALAKDLSNTTPLDEDDLLRFVRTGNASPAAVMDWGAFADIVPVWSHTAAVDYQRSGAGGSPAGSGAGGSGSTTGLLPLVQLRIRLHRLRLLCAREAALHFGSNSSVL